MAMLTFAEEIMLLLLDDDTGGIEPIGNHVLNALLSGAVLMDLAPESRIDSDLETVFVVDATPTGDNIHDAALAEINAADEAQNAQHWVLKLSERGGEIQTAAIARLVERGILEVVDGKFLSVFATRRYPMIDNREQREVKIRILDVLLSDKIPDPRDVALICLADAGTIFRTILSKREMERASDRIAQVRKLDLIGQSMSQAIRKMIVDIAAAMAVVPV